MKFTWRLVSLILVCLLSPTMIYGAEKAKEKEKAMPEVVVEAERLVEDQGKITIKSEGLPAEVNIVTKDDLKKTPYTGNYLDMLRNIPGVTISKFPGDYGDRIGMRGFYSGHGREVAFFVDGVPLNLFDYTENGWADISWVIPEMVERIEVIKGPFSALYGDFALGGVINIITKKSDPSPSVGAYGGTYGTGRGVGVASDPSWSKSLGTVTPFLVWEGYTRGGYRTNSDYNRGQFFNKFTFPLCQGNLSVRLHYVSRSWGDPGWAKINDMKAGIVGRTSAVSGSDRGDSEMADVVLNYSPKGGEAGFHGTLYYAYHGHNTGRTYTWGFTPNPPQTRRDTFEHYFGWKLMYDYRPFKQLSLVIGNDLRYDYVSQDQWDALAYYNLLKHQKQYKLNRFTNGFFVQGQYKPFSFFKLIGGVRYDMFNIEVDNRLYPQNSGTASPDIWSPKVGVVITPYKDINIFANQGRGFRSPGLSELSPSSTTQKANFDIGVAKLETWDVGINALLFKRVFLSFDYYTTRYKRELRFNSATNSYENLGASKRTGIEVEAKIFVTKELTLYGSWADVRARLKNPTTPGNFYIYEVPEDQAVVGLQFQKPWGGGDHQVNFDFYYLRMGRAPLDSNGSPISSQFDQYRSKLSYRYKNWTMSVDATFTPRRYASDAALYTEDIWINPWPRWEVLGGIKYQFK